MNVIQEITQQTNAGTTTTARSIGNLASLAQDLKQSVSGFKLPGDSVESDNHNEDMDVDESQLNMKSEDSRSHIAAVN